MKSKHFIITLLTLFVSINAFPISVSNATWTDDNGTTWRFSGNDDGVTIYGISGTFPNDLIIPSAVDCYGYILTVIAINNYAFSGSECNCLTSITIPDGVTSVGKGAFSGCSNLTSVHIFDLEKWCDISWGDQSSNPLYYGHHLFLNQIEITNLVIPSNVTSIKDYAFAGCTGLTSVTIPNSVTSIGQQAFYGCCDLTSVSIGNSVTSIGDSGFSGCTNLPSINIPESVTSIGSSAFGGHDMIVNFASSTPCTQSGLGTDVKLAVPHGALDSYQEAWSALSNVIVDASHIEKDITITANESSSAVVETIGEDVLINVLKLKVTGTFNSYDLMVFRNKMINLMDLDLSEANVVANNYCYYQSYKSKDNVITGEFLPTGLLTVKLPKDITALEDNTFLNCSRLSTIELPEGITRIPSSAFQKCSSLASIDIPEGVTSIGQNAFKNCSNLKSITLPESLTSIESSLSFAAGTFYDCYSLTSIHLPKGLLSIGDYTFRGCNNLTEIHLPPYLTSIGEGAFSECSKLKDIYAYMPDIISIGTNTFNDYQHQQLYVPEFLYNNYYYDTNWSQFANINKTSLSPDDYDRVPTNSDIVFADGDERIPDKTDGTHVDGEVNSQGSFTVEGNEPQPFDEVDQILDGEGQGGSLIGTNTNLTVNTLRVKINVKAGRWYFFCFPYNVTIANCQYPGQYAWRYYDGAYRASNGSGGWKPVTGTTLTAYEGYAFQTSHTGNLIISFDHPSFGNNHAKPLNAYTTGNAANASWNLVGNPYSSFYDFLSDTFSSPITVYNNGTYEAYRPGEDDCHLQPYQAFFVQKPEGVNDINFLTVNCETYRQGQAKKAAHVKARRAKGIDPQRRLINLEIMNGEEQADRTRVVLNQKAKHDYELECDASKFISAEAAAQLYSVENGVQMAINERPFEGDIRLGYTAQKAGTLSIKASRMDMPMILVDTQLGTTFDLSLGAYEFETGAGTFNNRFMLRASDVATAINKLTAKTGVCIGTQDGGIAIGGAEGKTVNIYTTGGAQAASNTGNGFVSLKSGMYVVNVDGVSAKVYVK